MTVKGFDRLGIQSGKGIVFTVGNSGEYAGLIKISRINDRNNTLCRKFGRAGFAAEVDFKIFGEAHAPLHAVKSAAESKVKVERQFFSEVGIGLFRQQFKIKFSVRNTERLGITLCGIFKGISDVSGRTAVTHHAVEVSAVNLKFLVIVLEDAAAVHTLHTQFFDRFFRCISKLQTADIVELSFEFDILIAD